RPADATIAPCPSTPFATAPGAAAAAAAAPAAAQGARRLGPSKPSLTGGPRVPEELQMQLRRPRAPSREAEAHARAMAAAAPAPRATRAFYPDDPSNVYHSYLRDHVKFRILHAGAGPSHVHHLHAHQWLHSPNSDDSTYLDSQLIIPGITYTLEI